MRLRPIILFAATILSIVGCDSSTDRKVAVVVVTDLYNPAQDVGDNFDIVTPYALPEVDLKAVIFDVTEHFRHIQDDNTIRRDAGFVQIAQLNRIFDRDVPSGCAPFGKMRSLDDRMIDAPQFEQRGIDLLFDVLERSDRKVHIVSTGSCRPLAVAFNRRPELMRRKIAALHICAGASSADFMEWNIALDTLAAARLLSSGLPINLYPCATAEGPFDKGANNCFWALHSLDFVSDTEAPLCKYLVYQFVRSERSDYLNYLEEELPAEDVEKMCNFSADHWYGSGGRHYVWETAVWMQVAGLKLVEQADGSHRIKHTLSSDDTVFDEGLRNATLNVADNGLFSFEYSSTPTNVKIYYRDNPALQEAWLNEALAALYTSFETKLTHFNI